MTPSCYFQMTMIAREGRILAQPGDVYGIHYPNGATGGIVPYHSTGAPLCCGVSWGDLSRIHNKEIMDNQLPIGTRITTVIPTIRRLPALRPILEGKKFQCNVLISIILLYSIHIYCAFGISNEYIATETKCRPLCRLTFQLHLCIKIVIFDSTFN